MLRWKCRQNTVRIDVQNAFDKKSEMRPTCHRLSYDNREQDFSENQLSYSRA